MICQDLYTNKLEDLYTIINKLDPNTAYNLLFVLCEIGFCIVLNYSLGFP